MFFYKGAQKIKVLGMFALFFQLNKLMVTDYIWL